MEIDLVLDSTLTPSELAELGQLAEANGIRAIWCASYLDGRDPFSNLARLAESTRRIRMGPIALTPYELHPVSDRDEPADAERDLPGSRTGHPSVAAAK